jgi:transposase
MLCGERAAGRKVRLMFQDEGRFGRISDPRRCWGPPRFRPDVRAALVREYVYAYSALSPWDARLDSLVLPDASTACMNVFLEQIAARYPQEFIVMVLDGAGWHRSHALQVPDNMALLALPPYAPELNPVELVWGELREKAFHNRIFDSLDAVEDRLCEALRDLENDQRRIRSLAAWAWLTELNLNAN